MNPQSPSRRSVDVFADVVVAAPAGRLYMKGSGRSIGIDAGSWHAYRRLALPLLRHSRMERHRLFTRLGRTLTGADLELRFSINDREIARLDGVSGSGLLARGLATPGLRLRPVRLLAALARALFQRRRAP